MERVSDWHSTLADTGARTDDSGAITSFGDPTGETRAAGESAIVVPLTTAGLIHVAGPDAADFLNSQLTSDVALVSPGRAQYTGYCTPKGRLLASMLLFERDGDFWLSLPAALATDIAQRLRKFVLRAKVKLEDSSSELAMVGVTGLQAQTGLADALGLAPTRVFDVTQDNGVTLIALPGDRYLIVCQIDRASSIWLKLTGHMRAAGWNAWQLQSIRAGIATVTPPTQEAFIPQMLALDRYDGVSFSKGCYPGQEIVARTRYLGEVKRHLYFGRCSQSLAAGDVIVEKDAGATVGVVTDAAENSTHDWEFLAVLQRDATDSGRVLCTADGTAITALRRAGITERSQQ